MALRNVWYSFVLLVVRNEVMCLWMEVSGVWLCSSNFYAVYYFSLSIQNFINNDAEQLCYGSRRCWICLRAIISYAVDLYFVGKSTFKQASK